MKWSAKIGRFAGIDVFVHATFPLLLVWFGYISWLQTGSMAGVVSGIVLILILFLCVVLHEYGHALTARRFGIGTRHITLLPIGGIALLERMPKDPRQEILVALAGPAVNVAIAAGLWIVLWLTGRPGALVSLDAGGGDLLRRVMTANVLLAVFNMLPAFPMDGGRVLRAFLSTRMDRVQATRVAARIGQTLAVGLGLLGLMGNPFLLLIAVFIWIGAAGEAGAVATDARLGARTAGQTMITDFRTLEASDPLSRAVDLTLAGSQKDFPVLDNGELVGVLSQGAILRGLRDSGEGAMVGDLMGPARSEPPGAPLSRLLEELQEPETRLVCITNAGHLVGIVDLDNISEFLRIQSALAGR